MAMEPDWVDLGYTEDGIAINSYFMEHLDMMLGKMEYDTRMFGEGSRYTTPVLIMTLVLVCMMPYRKL